MNVMRHEGVLIDGTYLPILIAPEDRATLIIPETGAALSNDQINMGLDVLRRKVQVGAGPKSEKHWYGDNELDQRNMAVEFMGSEIHFWAFSDKGSPIGHTTMHVSNLQKAVIEAGTEPPDKLPEQELHWRGGGLPPGHEKFSKTEIHIGKGQFSGNFKIYSERSGFGTIGEYQSAIRSFHEFEGYFPFPATNKVDPHLNIGPSIRVDTAKDLMGEQWLEDYTEVAKKPGSDKYNQMTNAFFVKFFRGASEFKKMAGMHLPQATTNPIERQVVTDAIASAMYQGGHSVVAPKGSSSHDYMKLLRSAIGKNELERKAIVDEFKKNPLYSMSQPDRAEMYIKAINTI
jgi:hypothetical protein